MRYVKRKPKPTYSVAHVRDSYLKKHARSFRRSSAKPGDCLVLYVYINETPSKKRSLRIESELTGEEKGKLIVRYRCDELRECGAPETLALDDGNIFELIDAEAMFERELAKEKALRLENENSGAERSADTEDLHRKGRL